MKHHVIFIYLLIVFSVNLYGQVGIGTTIPDQSSILDISSNNKGLLIPRLSSSEINNITNPANGLLVYNTDANCIQTNSGTPANPRFECIVEINRGQLPTSYTLACNGNLEENSSTIVENSLIFCKSEVNSLYSDAAGTISANDGDKILNWNNSSTNPSTNLSELLVPTNAKGPEFVLSSTETNNNGYLKFERDSTTSLAVKSADVPLGEAFQFIMYFRMESGQSSNAAILSVGSDIQATSASFSSLEGSWQISRGSNSTNNQLVFRYETSSGDSNIPIEDISNIYDGKFHLLAVSYDGNRLDIFLDGIKKVDMQSISNDLYSQLFRFGVNRAFNRYSNLDLAEVFFSGASLTEDQFIEVQSYFLCKYALDASLLSADGPFSLIEVVYDSPSQFELQIYRDPTTLILADNSQATSREFIYDYINNTYYVVNDVPTPGLGVNRNIVQSAVSNSALPNYPTAPGTYRLELTINGDGSTSLNWVTP